MQALAEDEIHLCWLSWQRGADRSALRGVLAAYLGIDPAALEFASGTHGKPCLAGPFQRLRFNWSHCSGLAVVALALDLELGVDIEHDSRRTRALDIARRWFAPSELAALESLQGDARLRAFAAIWTVKEAVLKAMGHGLSFGLDQVIVDLRADGEPSLRSVANGAAAADPWRLLHPPAPIPGITSALAWQGPPRVVRSFEQHANMDLFGAEGRG